MPQRGYSYPAQGSTLSIKTGKGDAYLTTGRIFPVYSTLVGSISYHLGNWGHNLTELNNAQPILVLIGPEGGFHPDEVAYS
ncbi:MAG: hypothetical protein D3909_02815 [Candidatus Electrothrix sp. ATG1]|nr:hypothetical protein [Candidatus Electrothrix sp. ATG1]